MAAQSPPGSRPQQLPELGLIAPMKSLLCFGAQTRRRAPRCRKEQARSVRL